MESRDRTLGLLFLRDLWKRGRCVLSIRVEVDGTIGTAELRRVCVDVASAAERGPVAALFAVQHPVAAPTLPGIVQGRAAAPGVSPEDAFANLSAAAAVCGPAVDLVIAARIVSAVDQ